MKKRFPTSLAFGLAISSLMLLATATAGAELIAARITESNFETHHVGGPDADGGIDDWFLSNGTLCAVVSDPEHESPLGPQGGVLIDLGHCGRGDDQWTVVQPMLNLSQSHIVPVTRLETGSDDSRAWIETRAEFAGVEIVTRHLLSALEPHALVVQTRVQRIDRGSRLFALGTIFLHPAGQTRPFSLLRGDLERSRGFRHPAVDRRSLRSMLGSLIDSDVHVFVGAEGLPPISYGLEVQTGRLREPGGETRPLRAFATTGEHFTSINLLSRASWLDSGSGPPRLLDLARIPFMDLDPQDRIEIDYRIWVGDRADVAAITDRLWVHSALIEGQIDDPTARIHIETAAGAPVTLVRPDSSGTFSLRLPVGAYRARVIADADREATRGLDVDDGTRRLSLDRIELGAPGWVVLPVELRGRLLFSNVETDRTVVFGGDRLGFEIGDEAIAGGLEAPFLNRSGSPGEPERIALAPGRYRVIAVRGPEYAARETEVEVEAGQTVMLDLPPLAREAATPGWIAADLHVHSAESFDSALPQTRQIAAFAASGAEVLVATEHDRIVDPRPALREAGLEHELVTITGVEVTSSFTGGDSPHSTGHWNAFPVAAQRKRYRGGAPTLEGRRAHDAIADIRKLETAPFLQLNHPRSGSRDGEGDTYLHHLGVAGTPYVPTRPLTEAPNSVLIEPGDGHGVRDLDFDGIELLNGPDLLRYRRVRADWLSWLLQGEVKIATSNSDSHRSGIVVGLPRTYVETASDSIDSFSETDFLESLRSGRAYGTTGPLLEVHLEGDGVEVGLGGLFPGRAGVLRVAVNAASWVPLGEWRAFVNGELVHRAPIAAGDQVELPLAFARDAFVTVEVEGPAEGLYAEALPGFVPFAFTNPIFVDVDGNGLFDAPGLPDPLPATLRNPDAAD